VLPKFAQARAFPSASGFGARLWLADEIGEMRPDKGGDRLAMALETKAGGQFIGSQLKVGWFLQWYEILEKLTGFRRPIRPVAAARKASAELRAILYPTGAQPVKMGLADLEVTTSFDAVDLPIVELLEDMLEKRFGKAFGQLFFSQSRVEQPAAPWSRIFVGLRYAPASSNPRPRGDSPTANRFLLLNSLHSPFVPAPTSNSIAIAARKPAENLTDLTMCVRRPHSSINGNNQTHCAKLKPGAQTLLAGHRTEAGIFG